MPNQSEHSRRQAYKTLVRGPDGTLWLLSKGREPKKVEGEEKERVERILTKTEKEVSGVFALADMGVHVGDVFDGDKGQHTGI